MPLGKWESFGQCVGAQKRMGHSDESARKICGTIQAKTEGAASSQEYGSAPNLQMSQPEMKKEDDQGGNVTLTMQEAEALANAVFNGDLEAAKKILTSVMNIQEEAAPTAPPS
ncbi:MAG: hypothetical protein QOK66_00990 [Nitrososphaeraceae archaeon]|nr:hypothetical protein [Nitrososphaeraceae archaeon]